MTGEKKILLMNDYRDKVELLWHRRCEELAEQYHFTVDIPVLQPGHSASDWPALLSGYDAVITTWGSPVCSGSLLARAKKLRILGHAAGSVVAVTDESTYDTDVKVFSANPLMAETVAEWSLMMTLLAQRRLGDYAKLRPGETCCWDKRYAFDDIHDLTIGIWGLGDISRTLLRLLQPLHPGRVLVYSDHASTAELAAGGAVRAESFEQLLAQTDILHCLAGMTPANYRRLNHERLTLLRDGATVVNAGRANLVDNGALFAEVEHGRLNAILDVFETEPLPLDSKWYRLPKTLLTPHAAAGSGRRRYIPYILDRFHDFFNDRPLDILVDKRRFLTMTNEKCGELTLAGVK